MISSEQQHQPKNSTAGEAIISPKIILTLSKTQILILSKISNILNIFLLNKIT